MKDYRVFGNFGMESQTFLEDFHLASEAIRWAKRYCRYGLGGYVSVEVRDKEGGVYWEIDDEGGDE